MTTKQIDFWKGPFGDQYTERNLSSEEDIKNRKQFWTGALQVVYMHSQGNIPKDILEIGTGSGSNLSAINEIYKEMDQNINFYATEINEKARAILKVNLPAVTLVENLSQTKEAFVDISFTYGVLIHTHPAHRLQLMREMYKASRRWIFCIEYFAPELRPIKYHGEDEMLWLDDYGSLWLDNFNVRSVTYTFCWKRISGLDNVTFWIFEKVN